MLFSQSMQDMRIERLCNFRLIADTGTNADVAYACTPYAPAGNCGVSQILLIPLDKEDRFRTLKVKHLDWDGIHGVQPFP